MGQPGPRQTPVLAITPPAPGPHSGWAGGAAVRCLTYIETPVNRSQPIATTLTLASVAQIMREAVKDKSYRATPLGLLVGR
jgi:hypothetical protein